MSAAGPAGPAAATASEGWTRTQRLTLIATGLGLFMVFLDALIVNVALPDIQSSFGVGEAGLQWVVAAYSIGMAVFMMTSATLADLHGRRRLYVIGLTVFALGSLASGLAPSIGALDVARGVQGLAAATVNVTSLALLSAAFPEPGQKARAVGLWTAIASTATALGPTVGGVLTDALGWRSVFLVNLPVAVAAVVLTRRAVAESRDPAERGVDLAGQLLFVAGVGSFAFALIQGQDLGWTSPVILGCFAAALAALAAFAVVELRQRTPMMDLRLFADRTYTVAIITIFASFFSVYGMLLVVTQYFQTVEGLSALDAGLLILPFSLAVVTLSPVAGRVVERIGARPPIIVGQSLLVVGLVAVAGAMSAGPVAVSAGLLLVGSAGALLLTSITSLAMTSVPPERAGMASGIMSSQRAIGSTAGYAVLGAVLSVFLGATLDTSLETTVPDASTRAEVTEAVIDQATPDAVTAEVGPGRPLATTDAAQEDAIVDAAADDFVRGIQVALGVAIALAALIWILAFFGLPRAAEAEAATEAATLAREKDARAP